MTMKSTTTLPDTMNVVAQREDKEGKPYFVTQSRPVPRPAADEYLIKVAAAGLNGATQRAGSYRRPQDASDVLGLEISGTIAAIGPKWDGKWNLGDKVCALVGEGGYAEYCLAPATQIMPLPTSMDIVTAGGLVENICTTWISAFDLCRLRPGESILIHGGSSGFGLTAIQLAAAFGAKVYATAGSDEKCALAESAGATRAINYRTAPFDASLRQHAGEMDVILDIVGGSALTQNVGLLATNGRLCVLGFKGGTSGNLDLATLMRRRLTIMGSTVRTRSDAERARIVAQAQALAWPLIESGRFKLHVDSVFPFSKANEAHERMESGAHVGKIILTPQ